MHKQQWETQLAQAQRRSAQLHRKNSQIAGVRFGLFLIAAWAFFQVVDGRRGYGPILILSLTGFCLAMLAHQKNNRFYLEAQAQIEVLHRCLARFDGRWQQAPETGAEFLDDDQPALADLDVFGPRSLYQFCCMAVLPQGKTALASCFKDSAAAETIRERQETVTVLAQNPDFILADWTCTHGLTPQTAAAMASEKLNELVQPITLPIPGWFIRWMPAVTLTLLGLTLLRWISPLCFILIFFVQAALALFSLGTVHSRLQTVAKVRQGLQNCLTRCQKLDQSELSSPLIDTLKTRIRQPQGLLQGVKQLDGLLNRLSLQANPFLYLPAQLLLLWDLQCVGVWNQWQAQAGQTWIAVMELLGQLEALESLALIALTHPQTCMPKLHEETTPVLAFSQLTHPLLDPDQAIGNDFTLDHSLTLVTGSNMSGKTTFMRTIGLNQILAAAGGPVCAQSMDTSGFTVLTSMRIRDDVNEGISTFYGELLRIRRIIDAVPQKKPLLVLIDEIFKGTNSLDRIDGSAQVLRHLNHPWIRAMITTHDFELCALQEQTGLSLVNVHFEEHYQDQKIFFDYKLKLGRCTQRNARYLMKMIGITD